MHGLVHWPSADTWPAATAAIGILLLLAFVRIVQLQRGTASNRTARPRPSPGACSAAVAALLATGVGLNTNWRFASDYLKITSLGERSLLFAVAEASLLACALMAREEMNRSGRAGTPGLLVWAITAVASVSAVAEAHGSLAGAIFRICFGPLGAAILWHLAMGVEFRHHRGDAKRTGLTALLAVEARERILARVGITDGPRVARQIAQERALLRAVALVDAYSSTTRPKKAARIAKKLREALRQADVAGSETRKQSLLDQVAVARHSTGLATLDTPSPWSPKSGGVDGEAALPADDLGPQPAPVQTSPRIDADPGLALPATRLPSDAPVAVAFSPVVQQHGPRGELPDECLAQVLDWLAEDSGLTAAEVARRFGVDDSVAKRIFNEALSGFDTAIADRAQELLAPNLVAAVPAP